ncbi:MAG: hypothetical protein HYS44_03245 [Candidatus Niyogibacteria bacterium]|nr:hypothetical protein [Candidatus Niyogibacteria bacterium]
MPESKNGLEITFAVPVYETLSGVSPGGVIFFHQFIQHHDRIANTIILRQDYDVFESLTDHHFLFRGAAPDAVEFHVRSDLIRKIKVLGKDTVVFPK